MDHPAIREDAAPDVVLCDVGPRDGLQNEPTVLTPAVRAALCARLAAAGIQRVEAVSFVSPRHVPAMAGAEAVVQALDTHGPTDWIGLVLNERGFDRAVDGGLRHVNYTLGATDTFCRRNQGCSRAEAEAVALALGDRARELDVTLDITLAVSFGCPFEGRVAPAQTLGVADRVAAARPAALTLADTIGVAVPTAVTPLVTGAQALGLRVGAHFHDTRNTAIANAVAAIEAGCTLLDASVGGTGGCPFAPGATGNAATEDLVYLLDEMGLQTGVDIDAVLACSGWLAEQLGHPLPGAVTRAGAFPAVLAA
ncbi:MAG: pyruvate carboxyltransferase [Solirubrobacterales bacterium]|nr:pyruvate carboxyltransferase [Solirubrobacterales bacterium]